MKQERQVARAVAQRLDAPDLLQRSGEGLRIPVHQPVRQPDDVGIAHPLGEFFQRPRRRGVIRRPGLRAHGLEDRPGIGRPHQVGRAHGFVRHPPRRRDQNDLPVLARCAVQQFRNPVPAGLPVRRRAPAVVDRDDQWTVLLEALLRVHQRMGEADDEQEHDEDAQQKEPPRRARRRIFLLAEAQQQADRREAHQFRRRRRHAQQPPQDRQSGRRRQHPGRREGEGPECQHVRVSGPLIPAPVIRRPPCAHRAPAAYARAPGRSCGR